MAQPYIAEAYVVGVPDAEYMNRTGVLIRVKEGKPPSLQTLREGMAGRLATSVHSKLQCTELLFTH